MAYFQHRGPNTQSLAYTTWHANPDADAPVVVSVEYIEIDLSTTALTSQNLSKGQDELACVPFMTMRAFDSGR